MVHCKLLNNFCFLAIEILLLTLALASGEVFFFHRKVVNLKVSKENDVAVGGGMV